MVGDGDAMGVKAEILEDILGAAEGWLGVDHPGLTKRRSQPGGEGFGMSEGLQGAMEAKLALTEAAFESGGKLCREKLSGAQGWEGRSGSVMEPNGSDRATIRRRARHNARGGDVRASDSRRGAR